jgi:hypothetical protein
MGSGGTLCEVGKGVDFWGWVRDNGGVVARREVVG